MHQSLAHIFYWLTAYSVSALINENASKLKNNRQRLTVLRCYLLMSQTNSITATCIHSKIINDFFHSFINELCIFLEDMKFIILGGIKCCFLRSWNKHLNKIPTFSNLQKCWGFIRNTHRACCYLTRKNTVTASLLLLWNTRSKSSILFEDHAESVLSFALSE